MNIPKITDIIEAHRRPQLILGATSNLDGYMSTTNSLIFYLDYKYEIQYELVLGSALTKVV